MVNPSANDQHADRNDAPMGQGTSPHTRPQHFVIGSRDSTLDRQEPTATEPMPQALQEALNMANEALQEANRQEGATATTQADSIGQQPTATGGMGCKATPPAPAASAWSPVASHRGEGAVMAPKAY